ncbi:MAG: hypothetical protein HYU28_04355 [Actinobacteria bacterium]|nr:hypothetical protein [Actinomycetota bacterium]
MRDIVTSALFASLPESGVATLRFNFRGTGESDGAYSDGEKEPLDAVAALTALRDHAGPDLALGLLGWSFGADVAVTVRDPIHAGWFLVAPALRFGAGPGDAATDPRPKRVALAQHDQFRAPTEVEAEVGTWTNTRVDVVPGADHFFLGRTERLTDLVVSFCDELAGTRPRDRRKD